MNSKYCSLTILPIMTSFGPSCLWTENICKILKKKMTKLRAMTQRAASRVDVKGRKRKTIPITKIKMVATSTMFHGSVM